MGDPRIVKKSFLKVRANPDTEEIVRIPLDSSPLVVSRFGEERPTN